MTNLCSLDMLQTFPPKSVQLKKPFATRPWMGSEDNVGNLLMVRLAILNNLHHLVESI